MKEIAATPATPATQYISTEKWDSENFKMVCPFCGNTLRRNTNGAIGRDKMVWYDDCHCEASKVARQHNSLVEQKRAEAQA